jgi:hypothetical protein
MFGTRKGNAKKQIARKNLRMRPRGNMNGRHKERWMDGVRRGTTNHGLKNDDTRVSDKLVLDEGKPLYREQILGLNTYLFLLLYGPFIKSQHFNNPTILLKNSSAKCT